MIRCDLLSQKHAAPASPHPLVTAHRAYRYKRRVRRALILACVIVLPLAVGTLLYLLLSPHSPPATVGSGNALPESRRDSPNSAAGTNSEWPIIGPPVWRLR